jgi:hypothetical protein
MKVIPSQKIMHHSDHSVMYPQLANGPVLFYPIIFSFGRSASGIVRFVNALIVWGFCLYVVGVTQNFFEIVGEKGGRRNRTPRFMRSSQRWINPFAPDLLALR